MLYADFSKGYVLRMDNGEEFHKTLIEFINQKRIPSAFYQAIGTVTDVELGYFSTHQENYKTRCFRGEYELVSANGNISLVDGKPVAHSHIVLGDKEFATFSGHLVECTITLTAEIFLFPIDIAILRKQDPDHNFKCLDLPHVFLRGS